MTIQASVKSSCLAAGTAAFILCGCTVSSIASADPPIRFGEILTGFNSKYHEQPPGTFKQDLSGAATDGNHIIFVDDGGSPPEFSFVRVMSVLPDISDPNVVDIPFDKNHIDLEGATFHNDYFVVTTSLSSADEDQSWLTRFKIDPNGNELTEEISVNLRDKLMTALQQHFGDEWFNRIKNEPGRAGGLNIEGISAPQTGQDFILWGIRSPLFGDNFGNPDGNPDPNPSLSLAEGAAIIAKVHKPFSADPTFDFQLIHLPASNVAMNEYEDDHSGHDDHGIRAIEWIPKLHGYVIIGGPIPAADNYTLWRLRPNGKVDPITLEGFSNLCRPESVIQVSENGKDYLVVLSEESGASCTDPQNPVPYTFIMAEILP